MERLKVRPFERWTKPPDGTQARLVSGILKEGSYWLQVDRVRFRLPTQKTGSDDMGPFALVEETHTETQLPGGYFLRVEAQYTPGDSLFFPGCHVGVVWKCGYALYYAPPSGPSPSGRPAAPGPSVPSGPLGVNVQRHIRHIQFSLDVRFSSSGRVARVAFPAPERRQVPEG